MWVSENTYLAPGYDHRIKLYHSIVDVSLSGDIVTIGETKFYPPGKFNGAYLGLDIPADSGVEFEQTTRARQRKGSQVADVLADDQLQPGKPKLPVANTVISVINESSALMTVGNKSYSDTDSYRIFISMPTENYRYTSSVGINNDPASAVAGSFRGMSFSAAQRIHPETIDNEIKRLRAMHKVGVRVVKADGKFTVDKLIPSIN